MTAGYPSQSLKIIDDDLKLHMIKASAMILFGSIIFSVGVILLDINAWWNLIFQYRFFCGGLLIAVGAKIFMIGFVHLGKTQSEYHANLVTEKTSSDPLQERGLYDLMADLDKLRHLTAEAEADVKARLAVMERYDKDISSMRDDAAKLYSVKDWTLTTSAEGILGGYSDEPQSRVVDKE